LAILTCPSCARGGLRVPDGERGKVTCPSCGAEWFHPETVEFSEVEFRCSKRGGGRFSVISSRRSPLHMFVLKEIKRPEAAPSAVHTDSAPRSPEAAALNALAPSLRVRGLGGWLTWITGRKGAVVPSKPAPARREEQLGVSTSVTTHDADKYNWAGFCCPYCGASSFVRCARGHLTCDGTVEVRNGRQFYQCFCGHVGFISGSIKTFEAKQSSARSEPESTRTKMQETEEVSGSPGTIALPQSRKGGSIVQ
jgi:hypothetical protein